MSAFEPTAEQSAAIEHELTPLLVIAGAGTGKTTVMAERILHAVRVGWCRPDEVLGLTFTNKAAAHLKQRVTDRLGPDADVTIATYHSFGASLVAAHAVELGLHPRTEILNRAQAWQLLFAVFDEFRFEQRSTYLPRIVVDDALTLASRCADHLVPIEAVEADSERLTTEGRWAGMREKAASRLELCQVVKAYDRRKRERHYLDYGDQVALAVRLLREHPAVAEELRARHPVVLLDEYQDTNYAQRVLLQLLYGPGSAITAVGDDMQSIYGFRGAHLGNILEFDEHFPVTRRQPLETNRRSGPALVELANRIQAQVPNALPKELRSLEAAEPTTIECFVASDDAHEAREIAKDIAKLGPPWGEHAVLCRKRRLLPAIVEALEAANLPVDVVGVGGLLHRPEVVDLVSWLEVLATPSAPVALLRILEGPRYRIGHRDLAALARYVRRNRSDTPSPIDLRDAVDAPAVPDLSAEAAQRLAAFRAEHRRLSDLGAHLSVLDLAEAIVADTGLWDACDQRARENLLRFFDLAARFAPVEGDSGLHAFVEYVRLLDEAEEDLAEAHQTDLDAVRVMTIHQAKGLEFRNVWVPGLAGGKGRGGWIFPDNRNGENALSQAAALPWWLRPDDEGMPDWRSVAREADLTDEIRRRREYEEWRLLYVACTRAERRLTVSTAHWYAGPAEPQGPSRFYDFIASQSDLVRERFRSDPPSGDPGVEARERLKARHLHKGEAEHGTASRRRALTLFPTSETTKAATAPKVLSVSAMVSLRRCALQFYWSVVRPAPRPPSRAAELGTAVHDWVAARSARLAVPPAEGSGAPSRAAVGLRGSFLASDYATRTPWKIESPFELVIAGRVIRGRVDAVYDDGATVDVVDFKTGREPVPGDPAAWTQLDLYAMAATDVWGVDPAVLTTSYCYLRASGDAPVVVSRSWDAGRAEAAREGVVAVIAGLTRRRYDPSPGGWCSRCDFLPFCPAGQEALR